MMPTADLITDFLGNEMSPERERQFLLSVAASDALRLELKSHLMVDRILIDRVQTARVPESVRSTIFMAAGLSSGVAAGQGSPDASASPLSPGPLPADRVAAARSGFLSRLGGRITLAAAACALFGAGYLVGTDTQRQPASDRGAAAVVSPQSSQAAPSSPVVELPRMSAPASGDASSNADRREQTPSRARSGSVPEITRPAISAAGGDRAGSVSQTSSVAHEAELPDVPAANSRPTRIRPGAQQPVGIKTTIEKPSPEMREKENNANPLQDGGPR